MSDDRLVYNMKISIQRRTWFIEQMNLNVRTAFRLVAYGVDLDRLKFSSEVELQKYLNSDEMGTEVYHAYHEWRKKPKIEKDRNPFPKYLL